MPRWTGRLRSRLLCPPPDSVDPDVRGFRPWSQDESIVRAVGNAFLTGYRAGLEASRCTDAIHGLQDLPAQSRGFAMEGLAMAAGVRSALSPLNRHQFRDLVVACGERHTYMLHIGLGWAMARTPRILWPRLEDLDPLLVPLVLDGYGFHEVFFHTERVLSLGPRAFDLSAWPAEPERGLQHVMQGVGRGMWFVSGGSGAELERLFSTQPADSRSSLWAGAGLAATYAGGCTEAGMLDLIARSGRHLGALRQGAMFAVEARRRAGTCVPHTHLAARVLCGQPTADIHTTVVNALPEGNRIDAGDWRAYEDWRTTLIATSSRRSGPEVPANR